MEFLECWTVGGLDGHDVAVVVKTGQRLSSKMNETFGVPRIVPIMVRRYRQEHGGRSGALQILERTPARPFPVVFTTSQGLCFFAILSSLASRRIYAVHLQQQSFIGY